MDSIILAGGLGRRLGELAKDTPKPLIEVAGKPVLSYILKSLSHFYLDPLGHGKCLLTVNPGHEAPFRKFLQENHECQFGLNLELIVESPDIYDADIGPIKGLHHAYMNHVAEEGTEGAMVLAGDNISSLDLSDFYRFFRQDTRRSVIALYDSGGRPIFGDYARAELSRGNIVQRLEEKAMPSFSPLINTTNYIFTDEDMQKIGKYLEQGEKESVISWLVKNGSVIQAYKFGHYWFDVGTFDSLERANDFFTPGGLLASPTYWDQEYQSNPNAIIRENKIKQGEK